MFITSRQQLNTICNERGGDWRQGRAVSKPAAGFAFPRSTTFFRDLALGLAGMAIPHMSYRTEETGAGSADSRSRDHSLER